VDVADIHVRSNFAYDSARTIEVTGDDIALRMQSQYYCSYLLIRCAGHKTGAEATWHGSSQ